MTDALRHRPSREATLAVGLIVLAYVVTRVVFIHGFPYFLDEGTYAVFVDKAAHSSHELFNSFSIGREPLTFWFGIPWVKLGINPLVATRIVSAIAGFLTLVFVGLLGRRLGGNATGLVAAALCVVVPFFLVHDGIGIIEPLVTLVMAAALYVQVEFARRPDLRIAALLGLVFAAALLTKENTKPALVLLPLSLLCFDWAAEARRERLTRWVAGVGVSALFVLGAILLLHASSKYPLYEKARNQPLIYTVRTLSQVLSDPFKEVGTSWHIYRPALTGYLSLPLLVVAVGGAVAGFRRQWRLTTVIAGWVVVPFTVSLLFSSLPYPRHVMYIVPPIVVLMAYGLVEGVRWVRSVAAPRVATAACAVAIALLLLPALLLDGRVLAHPASARYPGADDLQYVTGTGAGSIWPAVARSLKAHARGHTVYVLNTRAYSQVLEFLLDHDHDYRFVTGASRFASQAQFSLDDQIPFYDPNSARVLRNGQFAAIGRFRRPRGGATLTVLQSRHAALPSFTLGPAGLVSSAGGTVPIVAGRNAGFVEKVRRGSGGIELDGWAIGANGRPAAILALFSGNRFLGSFAPSLRRPDIVRAHGPRAALSGFKVAAAPGADASGALRVFAVSGGAATALPRLH